MKPFQEYLAKGYYVARQLAPASLVDRLAEIYSEQIKPSVTPMLRQNTNVEPNELTEHGHVKQPLLDPHIHLTGDMAKFKDAILDVACCAEILEGLRTITLRPDHHLQQIMLFEQSYTPPHQDWAYLDSFPTGCLTAAWVALEDIDPTATRFFVVPGSQNFDQEFPRDWVWGSPRYLEAMVEVLQNDYKDQITVPDMKKGDVLFWTSSLIHGSIEGADLRKSRLSLTAHYIPRGFGFGNRTEPVQQPYPFPLREGRPIPYLDRTLLD